MPETSLQKFRPAVMDRAAIKNAPYNPRIIDSYQKGLLKSNLRRVGLLEPPIVNERTGNLVGGHQRLAVLDELEGSTNYRLTVALVDLSDEEEMTQNVFLNNPEAQGDWDPVKLHDMLPDIDLANVAFNQSEIDTILDQGDFAEDIVERAYIELGVLTPQEVTQTATIKEATEAAQAEFEESYMTVVFPAAAELQEFFALMNHSARFDITIDAADILRRYEQVRKV